MSSTVSSTAAAAGNSVISSTGIGSGLDITSIVASLTTAAGLAQNNQLADRKSTLTAQVSAYGTFSSALDTLQATLTTLQSPKALAGRTAAIGDVTIATASATPDAIPAQYSSDGAKSGHGGESVVEGLHHRGRQLRPSARALCPLRSAAIRPPSISIQPTTPCQASLPRSMGTPIIPGLPPAS